MPVIQSLAKRYSARQRGERAKAFLDRMIPTESDRIVDIGGSDGSHFHQFFPHLENVVIADIIPERLERTKSRYGYDTVLLSPTEERLPFDDDEFDIVFCSSVIEHVTGPKDWARYVRSWSEFAATAEGYQRRFASELTRIGKSYWVQTPNRHFPIEPHSLLPMPVLWIPRHLSISISRRWVKTPLWDFHPLTTQDMAGFFPDAEFYEERSLGFVKSITAYSPRTAPLPELATPTEELEAASAGD